MQYANLEIADRDSENSRVFSVVLTDESIIDRDGEVVSLDGLDLKNYMKNPVVLSEHDPKNPVARCISLKREGSKIIGQIQFPPEKAVFICDKYYNLIKYGVINAVSIGFFIKKAVPTTEGAKITASELAELSIVTIPANTGAQIIKSKKIEEAETPTQVEVEVEPVVPSLDVRREKMRLDLLNLNCPKGLGDKNE